MEESPADDLLLASEFQAGDSIGHYTVIRKIGAGGCGEVYLAEQTGPLRRRVALKVIKLGMDTASVIARFEAERRMLAAMDHPDIAKVFEAGATAGGRPYFAMEYVEGVPITRFADEQELAMPERLELFARVCLALQHAHQKGVIHRDLKPSNILVAVQDGVAAPKVIDFGIAKATQGRPADEPTLTAVDQFVGTPAYMSPEQAERLDIDIDTRSDVYSLGVLLYELLTGRPPFDPHSLQQAGLDEMRRIIREVDPPRPSTRLSTLSRADSTAVARLRGFATPQLSSVLRGDLDWIVMRCLEKHRDRRYGTAEELAADVRRHLRREPVVARPPSTPYRCRKFISRHRLACASAAVIALVLLLGAIVSTYQAIRATRAERVSDLARADAQRRQEQAEELLTFMLGDFRTELQKIGKVPLLDVVGDKASTYLAALDPRDQTDTTLLRHAKTFTQIGEIRLEEGRFAEAETELRAANRRASFLAARQPRNGEFLFTLGQVHYWLGVAARRRGDFAGAAHWLTSYRDIAVRLAAFDPGNSAWQVELGYGHHNLAVLEMDRGNYAAARAGFLAELELFERVGAGRPAGPDFELRQKIADLHSWLGSAADGSGDFAEAQSRYEELVRRLEALVRDEPDNTRWQLKLAVGWGRKALTEAVVDKRGDALADLRRGREILERLKARDPANRTWHRIALTYRFKEAALLIAAGEAGTAARIVAASRPEVETLAQAEPASTEFALLHSQAWRLEAEIRIVQGDVGAGDAARRAVQLGERVAGLELSTGGGAGEFLLTCAAAAAIFELTGESAEAKSHWGRILTLAGGRWEQSRDWRLLDPVIRALAGLDRREEARAIRARLESYGYRPPTPWPANLGPAPSP